MTIDRLICSAIHWYKREVSPKKDFSCAHRLLHHGDSCSTAVLDIVKKRGAVAGLPEIIRRFNTCRHAARELAVAQRTDLDCGLSGCFDVGGGAGCFGDLFSAGGEAATGGTSGGCCTIVDPIALFTGKRGKRYLGILGILTVVALVVGYFTYGSKISAVEIRLLDPATEDSDRKWKLVANSELPDYQIVLKIAETEVKSTTEHNESAANWVYLKFPFGFDYKNIVRLEITNRQLFSNKVLESFSEVPMQGEGEFFKYRLIRRWGL